MNAKRKNPRGMALLLVVTVLALASALGLAMLSSATLANRAGGNQSRLATADYLAESGLNIALYYLQNPTKAPSVNAQGYWGGTGGDLTISSDIRGTVNVTVTRDASDPWIYEIVCVAKAGTQSDTQITRTTGARVYVRNEYQIKHASVFNNNTTVVPYCTIQGDVWSSKNFGIKSGSPTASVTGSAYCRTALTGVGWLMPAGGFKAVPANGWPGPSGNNDLNLYATYSINDVTYSCDTTTASSFGGVTKNPSSTNPGGVIYKDATSGAFVLNSDTVINGTLVVKGDLRIQGSNIVINALPSFPALIVTGALEIYQPRNGLTVNGVCFVGTSLKSNGSTPSPATDTSTFAVNGALIFGATSGTNLTQPYNVSTLIKYDATKAKAPEMTCVQRMAKGVSVVRWGLP